MAKPAVLLFDGDCALCNRSVQFVLRYERAPRLHFLPLQSEHATKLLASLGEHSVAMDTIYLIDADGLHRRSRAVFRICRQLRRPWRWLAMLRWLPTSLCDAVYHAVGQRRYRWFGRAPHCIALQSIDPSRLPEQAPTPDS